MDKSNNGTILVLIGVIFVFFALFNNKARLAMQNKQKVNQLENTINKERQQAKVTELRLSDSLKVKQAEIETLSITKGNLKAKYNNILEPAKIKLKYVDRVTTATIETHSIDTITCLVDSFNGLRADYADNYARISVSIDTLRNAVFDYSVRDSLTIVNYTKKHSLLFGLIKWKSYEGCRVISHNPKSTPVTVESYNVIK